MDLLGLHTLPFLARRNYYYELKHILAWSCLVGLVEGQFSAIVVARTFDGSPRLIAIASATPAAAFLCSLFWGMLCIGRPKIRLMTGLCLCITLLVGTIGAIPPTPTGAIWFICQMAAAQALLAGVITLRSAVWKSNYPTRSRARITARLQAVRFVIGVVTLLVGASICDRDPTAYRFLYPAVAFFGLVGSLLLQKIHIRGERSELGHQDHRLVEFQARAGLAEPLSLTALLSPGHIFGRMVGVLRRDKRFTKYLIAQSFVGVGNFMTIPVVVFVVTQEMDLGLSWGFWISTGLIQALPQLVRMGSISRWARLFDRVGVVQFRVFNVSCWAFAMLFGMMATIVVLNADRIGASYLPLAAGLFAMRGFISGFGMGGGSLAWNIGHLHFAKAEEAEVYMGIHVFLTGLRGLIAPLLGMWIFQHFGWVVWLIALLLSVCSVGMYALLARQENRIAVHNT